MKSVEDTRRLHHECSAKGFWPRLALEFFHSAPLLICQRLYCEILLVRLSLGQGIGCTPFSAQRWCAVPAALKPVSHGNDLYSHRYKSANRSAVDLACFS